MHNVVRKSRGSCTRLETHWCTGLLRPYPVEVYARGEALLTRIRKTWPNLPRGPSHTPLITCRVDVRAVWVSAKPPPGQKMVRMVRSTSRVKRRNGRKAAIFRPRTVFKRANVGPVCGLPEKVPAPLVLSDIVMFNISARVISRERFPRACLPPPLVCTRLLAVRYSCRCVACSAAPLFPHSPTPTLSSTSISLAWIDRGAMDARGHPLSEPR